MGISGWGAWMGWQSASTPPPPPLATCTDAEIAEANAALPNYTPTEGAFVRLADGAFSVDGAVFVPRGINYYPSRYP